ncbi:hypothetical protein LTS18_005106 [Coniosporium uncinatum]|uniref:Uncharacterized protein n=1 Tax=Coniosporium uncinatum TaxID=93489 RepID=A0ACC3DXP8_9PEZI|nr:hypothetical protein LTS18_005106 [Coniosporium uncinatum]
MPPPSSLPSNLNQGNQWNAFNNQQQQGPPHSPALANTGGRSTPIHPSLWGISTEAYDLDSNNVSIMPPPSFGANGMYDNSGFGNGMNYGSNIGDDGSNGNFMGSDWLALPLDPLLNSYGADVNQTTYGPDVGGLDMLDLLLSGGSGSGFN